MLMMMMLLLLLLLLVVVVVVVPNDYTILLGESPAKLSCRDIYMKVLSAGCCTVHQHWK